MNSVFEVDPGATRFDKAFHFIQVGNFTRLETLGIMQHKTRILRRNNWFVDIAYPVLFIGGACSPFIWLGASKCIVAVQMTCTPLGRY